VALFYPVTVCVQRMHIIPGCLGTHVNDGKSTWWKKVTF